jgi:hypothetical protein
MGAGPFWTERELQFMRDNWRRMSWLEVAEALGRPHNSVRTKAKQLGLRKLPPSNKPKAPSVAAKEASFSPPRIAAQGGPARQEGEPLVTSATRVTVAPAPRGRFEVDSAPSVVRATECREWARRVGR